MTIVGNYILASSRVTVRFRKVIINKITEDAIDHVDSSQDFSVCIGIYLD